MSETIFKSSLWLNSLDESSEYSKANREAVEILRVSFKNVRRKAAEISNNIKESQKGLTLHDLSHLDSLWETAITIGGPNFHFNPIEAYIFGCAVLFHDLGMALILWDQEMENLKASREFKDVVFGIYKSTLERTPTQGELETAPNEIIDQAISIRLRDLHSFKAAELPMKSWQFKNEDLYLIEDSDLRQKLGSKIGTIAESHWWSVDEIRISFNKQILSPSPTSFPPSWTINNVKLACILRLADFIHIDDRRSPSLYYAIAKPKGLSDTHWNFQNKLNRAFTNEERLVFGSHTKFKTEDNQAWWLAYSTIIEIDKEIKSVDNLLIDLGIERFDARGVKGIENPILFSEYLKTENWEPADTQFKISDFHGVIEKLGGKELYGNHPVVALRELIQNARDALQAKRFYDPATRAEILVRYYKDNKEGCWLEVTDNGIGMSKSVLLYGLLDFGNSYWKGNLVRKDHPGLISSGFQPSGNYGIGFFSIFMIGDVIQVITKSITDGSNTLVLEFNNGISGNPILRKAAREEERFESGTTVRILSKKENLLDDMYKDIAELSDVVVEDPLAYICRRLAPSLPETMKIQFGNKEPELIIKGNDWKVIDPLVLLKRISGFAPEDSTGWNVERLAYISEFVRPLIVENEIVARATIVKQLPSNNEYSGCGLVTVGGLKQSLFYRFPGIWLGKNDSVNRSYAIPICTLKDLQPWLSEQYNLIISSEKLSVSEKRDIAGYFISLGFKCPSLPIAKLTDGWKSFDEIVKMNFGDHVLLLPNFNMDVKESSILLDNIISANYGTNVVGIDRSPDYHSGLWDDEIRNLETPFESDNYDLNIRTLFTYTVLAICESWKIPVNQVVKESIISMHEWKPIINVYKNKFGEAINEPVMVIVNPRKTNKRKIYKRYEAEIKRWIGNSDDPNFTFDEPKD